MRKIYMLISMIAFIANNIYGDIGRTGPKDDSNFKTSTSSKVLVVDFIASDTLTCSGIIQFTDLSNNGATAWVWNFGDGGSSIAQNPVHTYTTGGYFTVTLITVGIAGVDSLVKTNYIHVAFLTAPTVSPDTTICAYNPVTLTASGGGQIAWFDSISGGNQLDTGTSYTSGPLTATTTFYAASQQAQPSFYGGPADSSLGGGGNYAQNNDLALVFDCNVSCRLVSVKVYAQGAGQRTIYLNDNNGNQLNTITVNVPNGESRVNLNFDIQPGIGYELVCNGPPNLYRNNTGAVYPYDINGMISITGNNAGGVPDYYYFFYDWEVSTPPCVSARIPINVTVLPGPQASFSYSQYLSTFTCTDLTIGATSWSWDFGDGSAPVTTQNANHTYAAPGTYIITLTASNGSCSSTMSVTVNATIFDFSVNDTLTCTGIVQFTDLSNNGATAWIWQFGDGGSSTMQNPTHTYTSPGYFTVTFTTVGINGIDSLVKTDYVHVAFLTAPTVSPDTTICQYNPVTLTASGGGQIAWFDSISGGNQLDTGATFTSGPLVATTTFYAASQQPQPSFYGGPADTTIGTGMYYGANQDRNLRFNCITACRLVSVKVFAQGAGSRTIYLNDNQDNLITSVTANVPDGESRVYLNFDIQPGNQYRLGNAGASGFFRNDAGATYPYDVNGMLSITGNNAGPGAGNFYYFFYDWEVSTPPCVSPRIPVTVTVTPGPQASFIYNQNLNTFTCNDLTIGANSWSWDFGDGSPLDTNQNVVHTYATSGTYTITLTASNGTCSSSMSVIVNPTFTGINENYLAQVTIHPNPVKDFLSVNLPENAGKIHLSLVNSFGQLVYESSKTETLGKTASLDLTSYTPGVYILRIESNDQVIQKKIIKE